MADEDLPPRRSKPRRLPAMDQENTHGEQANTDPPRRKRQKPPRPPPADDVPPDNPPPNVGSKENLMSPDHEPGGGAGGETTKKKRKRRTRPAPEGEEGPALGVAAHLDGTLEVEHVAGQPMMRLYGSSRRIAPVREEDRLDSDKPPVPGDGTPQPHTGDDVLVEGPTKLIDEPALNSQPADLFFTEHKSGFRKETVQQYRQRIQEEMKKEMIHPEYQEVSNLTRQFAISFQRAFRVFCTFLHGIFAGFATAHCIFVFMLPCSVFLTYYGSYLEPLTITYFIVIVFLCVSACDRYDVGKPTKLCCQKVVSCKIPGVIVLIYGAAFIINNAMFGQKTLLHTYNKNLTYYSSQSVLCTTVGIWRALDATRTALLALGWLILTFSPIYDRLEDDLAIDMGEEEEEEANEMMPAKH